MDQVVILQEAKFGALRVQVRDNAWQGVHNHELMDDAENRPMRSGGQLPLRALTRLYHGHLPK